MDTLNEWALTNLGTWVTEYATLFLIIAAVLVIVLILTFIICALCHARNIKKFKKLKASSGEQTATADSDAIRAEVEAQVRAEYEAAAAAAPNNTDEYNERINAMTRRIDELTYDNRDKQNKIEELSAALTQANNANSTVDKDYYRQLNELNQTVKEQENEINLLKAENSQIKAQALQQQLAQTTAQKPASSRNETPVAAQKTSAAKSASSSQKSTQKSASSTQKTAAKQSPVESAVESKPASEDEYDEYYDDYGDANSEIKVTLKFDRAKNSWIILRSDTDRTYRRLSTKQEALGIAKDLARRLHAQLVVHKKDGKFQKI